MYVKKKKNMFLFLRPKKGPPAPIGNVHGRGGPVMFARIGGVSFCDNIQVFSAARLYRNQEEPNYRNASSGAAVVSLQQREDQHISS